MTVTVYKGATKTVMPDDPEPPTAPTGRKRVTAPVTAPEPDTPVPTDG